MRGRRVARVLWGLAGALVLFLVLKSFVADVYRISSGSMRPTLFGGRARPTDEPFSEWVLLLYERAPRLARWDLVARESGDGAVVKRAAGLPGETVQVVDGDLLVDGRYLPHDAPRPEPIPVFDDTLLAVEDFFTWKHVQSGSDTSAIWRHDEQVWTLDATSVPRGSNQGMMFYHPEFRDDYFDQLGRRVVGKRTVNDVVLELEFALDAGQGALRFQVVEKGDTFEVRILSDESASGSTHVLELVRRSPSSKGETVLLERQEVQLSRIRFYDLSFANVDNTLRVRIPEAGIDIVHAYERNELHPLAASQEGHGDQSVGPRAGFGGEGVRALFRSIRLLRDLHYTHVDGGAFGVDQPLKLGPDEIFLLGDNSRISNDSRHYGPVPLNEIVGRPSFVLWPWSRLRRLEGAAPAE